MNTRRQHGLTLVELMIAVSIISLLLGLALPGFRELGNSTRLKNYANELSSAIQMARSEAIKRNEDVRLCATSDGSSCATEGGWETGWLILDASNNVLGSRSELNGGMDLDATRVGSTDAVYSITFASTGLVQPSSLFVLCRKTPSAGKQEREILLYPSGQPKVTVTSNGFCT